MEKIPTAEEQIEKTKQILDNIIMKKKNINVVVTDYSTISVIFYVLKTAKTEDLTEVVEEFIMDKGHHLSECHYMFSEKKIEICFD